MRPVHIAYDSKSQSVFASTNRGTILRLDLDLKVQASSLPVYNLNSLFVMAFDDDFIFAREITGKLVRWHKQTLVLDQIVDLTAWSSPEIQDVPNVSNGLFLKDDFVYVSMPSGALGKFHKSNLRLHSLSSFAPHALMESVSFDGPDGHFGVDFAGYVYKGDIDQDLKVVSRMAFGACHQIIYDRVFDRYWVTDDIHCGLGLFKAENPQQITRLFLTNDDVEWLRFNADQSEALVACFDRYIYRIRNLESPEIIGKIGPLKYQVKQVCWGEDQIAYALTESGEIYKINLNKNSVECEALGTNAVWDIQPVSEGSKQFWVAFEDGMVRKVEVGESHIETLREFNLGGGMVRRLLPQQDGGILTLAVNGVVSLLDSKLRGLWTYETSPLARDFAIFGQRLLLCTEAGELTCLNSLDGKVLWTRNLNAPLWSVAIHPEGQVFHVSERLCVRKEQGQVAERPEANVWEGQLATGELVGKHGFLGNIKRMKWLDPENLLVNGNGEVATRLIHRQGFQTKKVWKAWQLNTCESTLVLQDRLFTTTYGYQLNTFGLDGEILESAFPFEDYATSLAKVDGERFLSGGRGAFLSLFKLKDGLPQLVTTKRYL